MTDSYLGADARVTRIKAAVDTINNAPLIDVQVWNPHGEEHFHPDVGEYWKPGHVTVEGDMNDLTTLRVLSKVLDKHGLKVHVHHGTEEWGPDWARLVVDHDA